MGVVPKEVMPETAHSNSTRQMLSLINERLRAGGYAVRELAATGKKVQEQRTEKISILKDVYRILLYAWVNRRQPSRGDIRINRGEYTGTQRLYSTTVL